LLQPKREKSVCVEQIYREYSIGKQTLAELSLKYHKSERTIRRYFDKFTPKTSLPIPCSQPVSLVFDGTFWKRGEGLMIYRVNGKNIYSRAIDNEKLSYIEEDLLHLQSMGWKFSSFTIDGRRGVIKTLEKIFPNVPIQICIFHQKKIVQRYMTLNPKTDCGKEIKELLSQILTLQHDKFSDKLNQIKAKYYDFLREKNENNQFMHRRLRSAIRSLTTNLPYLFAYKNYTQLAIPSTTNSCDGSFAHWKSKVKIHRGLRKDRKAKMTKFLLNNT